MKYQEPPSWEELEEINYHLTVESFDEGCEPLATAAHEAGHFVMGILASAAYPHAITIEPNAAEGYNGMVRGCHIVWNGLVSRGYCSLCEEQHPLVQRDILVTLSGYVAQCYVSCWSMWEYDDGFTGDFNEVRKMLAVIGGRDFATERAKYETFAHSLLKYKRPQRALRAVIAYLLEHKAANDENGKLETVYYMADKILGNYKKIARQKIGEFTGLYI